MSFESLPPLLAWGGPDLLRLDKPTEGMSAFAYNAATQRWEMAELGSAAFHDHDEYLAKSGGTLTGPLTISVPGFTDENLLSLANNGGQVELSLHGGSASGYAGIVTRPYRHLKFLASAGAEIFSDSKHNFRAGAVASAPGPSVTPLLVQLASGQSGNGIEQRDISGIKNFSVGPTGNLSIFGALQSYSEPPLLQTYVNGSATAGINNSGDLTGRFIGSVISSSNGNVKFKPVAYEGSGHAFFLGSDGVSGTNPEGSTLLIWGNEPRLQTWRDYGGVRAYIEKTTGDFTTVGKVNSSGGTSTGPLNYIPGVASESVSIRSWTGGGNAGIYLGTAAISPNAGNYSFIGDGSAMYVNAASGLYFRIGNQQKANLTEDLFDVLVPTRLRALSPSSVPLTVDLAPGQIYGGIRQRTSSGVENFYVTADGSLGFNGGLSNGPIRIKNTGSIGPASYNGLIIEATNGSRYAAIDFWNDRGNGVGAGNPGFQFGVYGTGLIEGDTAFFFNNSVNGDILFATKSIERMRIKANGDVKIGNSSFASYTSGYNLDALKTVSTSPGAAFGVQNLNSGGFSGIEYLDHLGNIAVFTGYKNGESGEFRFNNIASQGFIDFLIANQSALKIRNDRRVISSGGVDINASSPTIDTLVIQLASGQTSAKGLRMTDVNGVTKYYLGPYGDMSSADNLLCNGVRTQSFLTAGSGDTIGWYGGAYMLQMGGGSGFNVYHFDGTPGDIGARNLSATNQFILGGKTVELGPVVDGYQTLRVPA